MRREYDEYEPRKQPKSLVKMSRMENDRNHKRIEEEMRRQDRQYRHLMKTQVLNPTIGK